MFNTALLNKQQNEAVRTLNGPLLIMAGAGSGKTRTVIHRIDHLIETGVAPENILAITFTNKAAKELKERLSPQAQLVLATTIHSFCVTLLRQYAKYLGFQQAFNIIDTDDQTKIINNVKSDLLDDIETNAVYQHFHPMLVRQIKARDVQSKISLAKNHGMIRPEEFKQMLLNDTKFTGSVETFVELYERYSRYCQQEYLLDFDDLLLYTKALLISQPLVLNQIQEKYQYITVDEYQDTNVIQNEIIDLIARKYQNLCVVGDADQSIYAFRGAKVQNIIQFAKRYPNTKIVYLDKNYRSKQTILDAGNDLINNNEKINNKERHLQSDKSGDLHNINIVSCGDDHDEAAYVAMTIQKLRALHHYDYKDFAIIYRNNALNRTVQQALRQDHIPHIVYNGMNFYSRKEVKDIIAYLSLCVNPHAGIYIERIINTPTRGIGTTTLKKLKEYARQTNQSLATALTQCQYAGIKPTTCMRIQSFIDIYQVVDLNSLTLSIHEAADALLSTAGYYSLVDEDEDYQQEIVEEFLEDMRRFDEANDLINQPLYVRLTQFLQFISLQTSNDRESNDKDQVQLMTIHGAKGLEFPVVLLVGWDTNIFPNQFNLLNPKDLEEERRLAYVAITRAKDYLYITHTDLRNYYGNIIQTGANVFINEIKKEHVTTHTFKRNKNDFNRYKVI